MEPAGVLYLPARDVVNKADRAIAPDKLAALLRGELRRTGMVLSDPEVLTAMEHSALESPCYLPIAVKKDGSVSGLAASVLAWRAFSAFSLTVEVNSSIEEAVSSRELACCSVRDDRSMLPAATCADAVAIASVPVRT